MPFFLDGNPTQGEISEAVNYLLSNFGQNVTADTATGQIVDPTGAVSGYLYKYLSVKYADSFDGTVNFSDTPTNRKYYGIRNTSSSTESTNPADYIWYKLDPATYPSGFGTTYFLWYITTGGRQIQFAISSTLPNSGWLQDSGAAIDLDIVSGTNGVANFVVIRITNNSAQPTDAECISAIGRTPIAGDLCTINYNSGISSIVYKYTTGWAIFQKYITGDLIVANSIVSNNIAANTITASNIAANTITGANIDANTVSASNMVTNTITAASGIIADATITTAKIVDANVTTLKIGLNSATSLISGSSTGGTASCTVVILNTATFQVIGQAALPNSSTVILQYKATSSPTWITISSEIFLGGTAGVLTANVGPLSANSYDFRMTTSAGANTSVIVFASIR